MTVTTDNKRLLGQAFQSDRGMAAQAGKPELQRRGRWLLGVLVVTALAAALLFCHGCHGDVDDELFVSSSTKDRQAGATHLAK
jgi:hypothetical protein